MNLGDLFRIRGTVYDASDSLDTVGNYTVDKAEDLETDITLTDISDGLGLVYDVTAESDPDLKLKFYR